MRRQHNTVSSKAKPGDGTSLSKSNNKRRRKTQQKNNTRKGITRHNTGMLFCNLYLKNTSVQNISIQNASHHQLIRAHPPCRALPARGFRATCGCLTTWPSPPRPAPFAFFFFGGCRLAHVAVEVLVPSLPRLPSRPQWAEQSAISPFLGLARKTAISGFARSPAASHLNSTFCSPCSPRGCPAFPEGRRLSLPSLP